jgi:cytochrome c oxidase assembly factor CtaG
MRRLTLRYVAVAILVAIGFLAWWALVPEDPNCSEPPCGDDVPFLLGVGIELTVLITYALALAGLALRTYRERRR